MAFYRKNALTGVTRATFRFIFENRTKYVVFFAIAMFLYMVLEVALGESQLLLKADSASYPAHLNLIVLSLFYSVITAVIAAPLHNQIIVGSKSFFMPDIGRLLIFSALEFLLSFAVALGVFILSNLLIGSFWAIAVPAILFVGATFLGIIFTTVLPHVAVTPVKKLNLLEAASLSAGFRIEIFARLFRLAFAIGLIVIGGRRVFGFLVAMLPSDDTIIGYYTPLAAENFVSVASLMIFVTLASLIYVRLTNHKDELNTIEPKKPE